MTAAAVEERRSSNSIPLCKHIYQYAHAKPCLHSPVHKAFVVFIGPAHSFPVPFPFPNTANHTAPQPLSPAQLLLFTPNMESTFKLHPLPKVALEALQAAASAEGCPEGMAIVGGLTEVSGLGGSGRETEQKDEVEDEMGGRRLSLPCLWHVLCVCVCVWLRLGGTRRMAVVTVSWSLCVWFCLSLICPLSVQSSPYVGQGTRFLRSQRRVSDVCARHAFHSSRSQL